MSVVLRDGDSAAGFRPVEPDEQAQTLPPLSEEDRGRIQGLSPPGIRSWALKKAADLCHSEPYYVCRLHVPHNSALPFNQLPPEVLLLTLGFLEGGGSDSRWAIGLTSVCRYWRETLLAYPLLWSSINLGNRKSFIQLCLSRSGDVDLSVCLHDATSRLVRPSDTPSIKDMLAPHFHRIARLALDLEPCSLVALHRSSMLSMLNGSMDRLKVLRLSSVLEIGQPLHLHLDKAYFPRLETLSLESVSTDWNDLILPNLTTLRLTRIPGGRRRQPTLDALLNLLEAASSLQVLHLTSVGPTLPPTTSPSSRPPVRLGHLQTFVFISPSAQCIALLSHLSLPAGVCMMVLGSPLTTPIIDATVPADAKAIMTVLPADMKHSEALSQVNTVRLEVREDEFALHAHSNLSYTNRVPALHVILDSREEGPYDPFLPNVLAELPMIFPDALTSLVIDSNGLNLVGQWQWRLIFAAFPHIVKMCLSFGTPLSQEYFTALRLSGDLVPWQKLQVLGLRCEQGSDNEVSDMLNALQLCLEERSQVAVILEELRVTAPLLSRCHDEYLSRFDGLATVLKLDGVLWGSPND